MRHLRRVLLALSIGFVVLGPTLSPSAAADAGEDDVSVAIQLASHFKPITGTTIGPSFQMLFSINPRIGLVQVVKLTVALPDGLRWGYDGPDPGEGCQGTAPSVCTRELTPDPAGNVGGGWGWDVIADRPGTYQVTATVETTLPDPDTSNNTATLQFQVTEPATGSTGGGGTSSSASVTATAAKLKPARPRAGSTVVATVHVTAGAAAIRPTRITCGGKVGNATVRGRGTSAAGSANCRYTTPRSGKGQVLHGTISFTARSKKITRRFSVRLR